MRVREKTDHSSVMQSTDFNVMAIAEVICWWEDGSADSMFIKDLEVFITRYKRGWKDMNLAFKDRNLITDNENTIFFEPANAEDRVRGFTR